MPSHAMNLGKWLLIIAVALLAALVCQCIVIGLGFWPKWHKNSSSVIFHDAGKNCDFIISRSVFGAVIETDPLRSWYYYPITEYPPDTVNYRFPSIVGRKTIHRDLPSWSMAHIGVRHPEAICWREDHFGFPLTCFSRALIKDRWGSKYINAFTKFRLPSCINIGRFICNIITFATPLCIIMLWKHKLSNSSKYCSKCSYNLDGISAAVCPECGFGKRL